MSEQELREAWAQWWDENPGEDDTGWMIDRFCYLHTNTYDERKSLCKSIMDLFY
jgi:hypothetical protein